MDVRKTLTLGHCIGMTAVLLALGPVGPASADDTLPDDFFAQTPAFSAGDQPAQSWAKCGEVRAMSAALPATEARVDLSVTGKLTSIRTDGVLWYLTLCATPDVRILCVAYNDNA